MRRVCATIVAVGVSWATNAAAQRGSPALHAPTPVESTALEVASMDVLLDCQNWKSVGVECQVTATYQVVNPTEQTVAARLEVRSGLVKVTVDGAKVAVREGGFELSVDPGATRAMVTTKRVRMWPPRRFGLGLLGVPETMAMRHMAFGGVHAPPTLPSMFLPVVDTSRWAAAGDAVYTARYPRELTRLDGWDHDDAGGRRVATARGSAASFRYFNPQRRSPTVKLVNGGPYLDIGGTFGEGFRLALGYEIGLTRWLFAGASAETHFDDVVVTPVFEIGLFTLGTLDVGAPVRLHPEVEVGARVQLALSFVIGFIVTVDYWPDDEDWQTTLSGRLSL